MIVTPFYFRISFFISNFVILFTLMVYGNTGRQIIYQKKSTSSEIDVSSFTNGNYLFVIKNDETLQTNKYQILIIK